MNKFKCNFDFLQRQTKVENELSILLSNNNRYTYSCIRVYCNYYYYYYCNFVARSTLPIRFTKKLVAIYISIFCLFSNSWLTFCRYSTFICICTFLLKTETGACLRLLRRKRRTRAQNVEFVKDIWNKRNKRTYFSLLVNYL